MDHPSLYIVRQRWQALKDQERNFVAAFFHMCTVALVCTSLAALGWFRLRGAPCSPHLAVYQFFTFGHYTMDHNPAIPKVISNDAIPSPYTSMYHSSNGVLSCVTPEIASLMRVIILLCFLALACSLTGFLLDIYGPSKPALQIVRRASLPSILAVLWVSSIIGACYNLTVLLHKSVAHISPDFDLHVNFEYGVYTISAAGLCAVAATACNLLNVPPHPEPESLSEQLVDDWDGMESFAVGPSYGDTPLEYIPPPPYSP